MADTDQTPATPRIELPPLPADAVPIVALRNVVLFPGIVLPITLGREESIAAAQEAVRTGRKVGLLLQRDPGLEKPEATDLYELGVLATVVRYVTAPDGAHHLICQGESRFRLLQVVRETPFLAARIEVLPEPEEKSADVEARMEFLKHRAVEALSLLPQVPAELARTINGVDSPGQLADLIVSFMDIKPEEKQDLLETLDLKARLDKVVKLLAHRVEVLKITRDITQQTQAALGERQREAVLREQLHQLQKELGEGDGANGDVAELDKAITAAHMPAEVDEHARKELKRLERTSEASPEYGMVRTYLDWLVALPWSKADAEDIDIERARRVLDEDHYGLEKVKRRILEYLAVRKLNPEGRSPILCFVGPPGVGKTSLGQSVARALGLKFVRASLGGVHDEAEIRGHRRTYVGALPGNIIQGLRKGGTHNPVFMLDEIDKLGASFQGDPASALLEVLDPEQNSTFRDNYLGLPFDLSHVLFIATANVLDTIPGPLRDRMEIIELTGYTEEEKLEIAKRYLVARQLKANGLKPSQASLSDAALTRIIREYTRESGCRNLERQIGALLRRAAMRIAEGKAESVRFEADDVAEVLGATRFENEVAQRTSVPGVATGLAWTPVGGDILFVESARMPGSGKLILTGQLGDVMKESAQAALSLVKAQAAELGIDPKLFDQSDIHVHVPAGAIPKDGPSAGVAMFVSLASLLKRRSVRPDVAMTGEISLRGLVLPIGGVKEKTIAAARAGIRKVILPARNRRDLEDIPQSARAALELVWVERVSEALEVALAAPTESQKPVTRQSETEKSEKSEKSAEAEKSAA
ncbi:MAG TPA: endopeptidase La [Steroidobacteraceae bacterium]|jgi:ATP-dependent Lon protease|nr:endopeptidase La [Steroidobacteraceae bacterium]